MAKPFNPLSAWLETVTAMSATSTTIAMRVMRINTALLAGDVSGGSEAKSMVCEKITAAQDGYVAALAVAPRLWSARSGQSFLNAAAAMNMAASAPALKKVRANAKRLTSGSPKKR